MLFFLPFFIRQALKIIRKSQLSRQEYEMAILEAKILMEQKHPNIVGFLDLIDEILFNGSRCMMILLEYCPVNQNISNFS